MSHTDRKRLGPVLLALGMSALLAGCATTKEAGSDPIEGTNRAFYQFNDGLDKYVLEPVAKKYEQYTPELVREGVTNFFDNVLYLNVIFNDFLQGKFSQGLADTGRFAVNSTLGLGGLLDPASALGLQQNSEDFGQTLGVWGAGEGAYLVLPFKGPNSLRDAPDIGTSLLLNPLFYISSIVTIPVGILGVINERANLLDATRIRDEAALDPYTFTREAYRQKRLSLIHDGEPPRDELEEFMQEDEKDQDPGVLKLE